MQQEWEAKCAQSGDVITVDHEKGNLQRKWCRNSGEKKLFDKMNTNRNCNKCKKIDKTESFKSQQWKEWYIWKERFKKREENQILKTYVCRIFKSHLVKAV